MAKKKGKAKKTINSKTIIGADADTSNPAESREEMIQKAAYYQAEKSGFTGDPNMYWREAEKRIDEQIKGSKKKGK